MEYKEEPDELNKTDLTEDTNFSTNTTSPNPNVYMKPENNHKHNKKNNRSCCCYVFYFCSWGDSVLVF